MKEYAITDLCSVIRSKQAGPFRLTFDLMFKSEKIYNAVKASGQLREDLLCELYKLPKEKVTHFIWYDPGWSVKVTIIRPRVAASLGDGDIYGCQQHVPLLSIKFNLEEGLE